MSLLSREICKTNHIFKSQLPTKFQVLPKVPYCIIALCKICIFVNPELKCTRLEIVEKVLFSTPSIGRVNNSADCGLRCLPAAIIGENADDVVRGLGEMFSPLSG